MKSNPVVHFEIYADDPEALQQFYTRLFDWHVQPVPQIDYSFVSTVDVDDKGMPKQPGGINGGMMKRPAGYTGRGWISYVLVDSVDAAFDRALELGATAMKEKSAVPGMGWYALLTDPQGNPFGLWQSDGGAK